MEKYVVQAECCSQITPEIQTLSKTCKAADVILSRNAKECKTNNKGSKNCWHLWAI